MAEIKKKKKNKHKSIALFEPKFIRDSVRTKLILTIAGLLILTIVAFWIMNKAFLPTYYQYSKVSSLSKSFENVNEVVNSDKDFIEDTYNNSLSDDSTLNLEIYEANSSMNVYVFELTKFFNTIVYSFDYPSNSSINEMDRQNVKEKTQEYVMSLLDSSGKYISSDKQCIRSSEKYNVYKVYDQRIGSYYLELFGVLDSGSYVYMRTNYQSMSENVRISNRFLSYIGIGAILLEMILMLFISNGFTKPILRMTDIAKRMAALDFEAKYPVNTNDEIGLLGNSINTLSETLETTIQELKTANNELQKDIENKIQIDEMRKEFLSNVSHELKTPIALIQGYAEGLADNINEDSESRKFYCDVIMDEAGKMNKMVKKLLTLNQIEFGKNQVNFDRFNIMQVISSVANSAKLLADQKEAVISVEEHEPVYVWADEYMVEEVVTNYISNAINHVDGEKYIRVNFEDKGDIIRINVFNTGSHIPEDELDKVWIKFYKVDKARTRAYGGSGIGLSIVKAIVESMNRECGVENKEDGVLFWFELDKKPDI